MGKILYPSLLWNLPASEKVLYLTFDDGPIPEVTPRVLSLLKQYNAQATFFCIGDNVEKNPDIFTQILAEGHSIGNHTYNHLNGWKTRNSTFIKNVLLAEEALFKHQEARNKNQETRGKKQEARVKSQETREKSEDFLNAELNQIRQSGSGNPEPAKTNTLIDFQDSSSGPKSEIFAGRKLFRPPYGRIKPSQIKELKQLGYDVVMWGVVSMDFNRKLPSKNCFKIVTENAKAGSIVVFHDSLKAEKNLMEILPQVLEYYSSKGYSFKPL